MFINQVKEQLNKMTDAQKDEWILAKAKLLPISEQQDFLMSLTGEKIITYMPTELEIKNFCQKVKDGDIYMAYVTEYFEFDDDGKYINNWKSWHNDPCDAFPFLNRVFKGCHDLIILKKYKLVVDILNEVCNLQFQVKIPENDGIVDYSSVESFFTIPDAGSEQLLTMSLKEIGHDWIMATINTTDNIKSSDFAVKLLKLFKMELCTDLTPSDFMDIIPDNLFRLMENILEKEVAEAETILQKYNDIRKYWHEIYNIKHDKTRKQELLLNIQMKCLQGKNIDKKQHKISILASSWKQISELLEILNCEKYIDDQWEIEEIKNICETLVKENSFEKEDWKIRKNILQNIAKYEYYDRFGCYDQMKALSEKLCFKDEEHIALADMLYENYSCQKEAASIYKKYGRIDKYISYLEMHLDRTNKEYIELINCYSSIGDTDKARQIAEEGLKNCREDLSDIYIYLLKDAKRCGDSERYKKLYSSAKRRKKSDINKIDSALE